MRDTAADRQKIIELLENALALANELHLPRFPHLNMI